MSTPLATALQQGLLFEEDESQEPLFGLVARVFILGSLPHSEPEDNEFHRSFADGRFRLSLLSPRDVGLPYGRIPRLILSQVTTQAIRIKCPELTLAPSLSAYCSMLGLTPTGGVNGSISQVKKQLIRLVNLNVKATWDDSNGRRGTHREGDEGIYAGRGYQLASEHYFPWAEKVPRYGSLRLRLSEEFFRLISHKPVPVDFSVLQSLQSPMAMDIYTFCTWRAMRALRRRQPETVAWTDLQKQLGSEYRRLRDFRNKFRRHLATVLTYYPAVRVEAKAEHLVVHPYAPHISRRSL